MPVMPEWAPSTASKADYRRMSRDVRLKRTLPVNRRDSLTAPHVLRRAAATRKSLRAGTPKVEQPHQRGGPGNAYGERDGGNDRKQGRDLVAVGRRSGEGCRQRRRYNPRDKKAQSYKPEHMRGDQAAKGILERHRLKPRRDIKLGNDAKGHKAGQHAQAEQCLNRHRVVSCLPVKMSAKYQKATCRCLLCAPLHKWSNCGTTRHAPLHRLAKSSQ